MAPETELLSEEVEQLLERDRGAKDKRRAICEALQKTGKLIKIKADSLREGYEF